MELDLKDVKINFKNLNIPWDCHVLSILTWLHVPYSGQTVEARC